ncbi:hypothetical protein SAMN05216327_10238 [Dyadobacter sp. SG02]|uniref:hypothetical protein n=1 Tax=Dyadobacter sp. SG02 TaxID=1855291 RepID=UPI0008C59C0F|nr:hypothetical protein [Dyadobacter sp. SG02]SEI49728.1 hypothetical protein SAMN05216327_10238 [Dyadobacter sp. SG02]
MKKIIIVPVLLFAFCLHAVTANAQAFQKGTKLIDAGFEIQESFDESVIPVFANFEAAVSDDIGVGAKVRYWTKYDVNSMVVQATGNYHFGRIMKLNTDKLDIFAGLGLGINRLWVSDFSEYSESVFVISPGIGARYFFTERFGVTGKLGLDTYRYDYYDDYASRFTDASFTLGVSFKF